LASAAGNPEYIRELFAGFGPVVVKRMFGGAGIYADGTMFALVLNGVVYLKADEQTISGFEREGLAPFAYNAKRKRVVTSYWRMPDRLYDDAEELAQWSGNALAAALRAAARKAQGRTAKAKARSRKA
jgi:DNA transformation protein and related proteins